MGANSQQGWSLFLFLLGFTFLPAGLFALGPIFTIFGLVCLVVAAVWSYRIKPLEHGEPGARVGPASEPVRTKQAV